MIYPPDPQPPGRLSLAYDILRLPRVARPLRLVLFFVVGLLLLPYGLTVLYSVVNPVSTVMLWRSLTGQRVEHQYVPLERISPALPLAVLVAEDGRFCSHHGVDFTEINNAIEGAEGLDDLRGGSTITQQLAKNLFLWPGRSFIRKGLEFPLALWIDLVLSKRRVLEIYLNIAEWGPDGEFGAEAILLHGYPRGDVLTNMWADLHRSCRGDLSCRSSFIPGDGVTFPLKNTAWPIGATMTPHFAIGEV